MAVIGSLDLATKLSQAKANGSDLSGMGTHAAPTEMTVDARSLSQLTINKPGCILTKHSPGFFLELG